MKVLLTNAKGKAMSDREPVVVCTEYRGVFFGYCNPEEKSNRSITLTQARMCVRWDSSMRGVLGLASDGPGDQCKISRAVESILLHGVTSIIDVRTEAVAKWEASPWSS